MFLKKFKGAVTFKQLQQGVITFKQLQRFADARRRWKFDEEMDAVDSDVELVNFKFPLVSDLSQEKFTAHFQPVKFERVFRIFNFPHEVECVLSESVLPWISNPFFIS